MTFTPRAIEAAAEAMREGIAQDNPLKAARDALTAALAVDGVALVPVEPTEDMLDFGACYEDPDGLYKGHPIFDEGDISRDIYRAMLAAAPEGPAPALQGWQPIESAPKDGTPVDLWCANSEFPNRVTDAQWRKPTESEWFVHGGDGMKTADAQWLDPLGWPMTGDDAPTHWQPLPPPPAASDREERCSPPKEKL